MPSAIPGRPQWTARHVVFAVALYLSIAPLAGTLLAYTLLYLSGNTLMHRQCNGGDSDELFWSAYAGTRMLTLWTCFHLLGSRVWFLWVACQYLWDAIGVSDQRVQLEWGPRWRYVRVWLVGGYAVMMDGAALWWRWWGYESVCDGAFSHDQDISLYHFCRHGVDTDLPMRVLQWIALGTTVTTLALLPIVGQGDPV